uniref:Iron-sulfur cluster assembly accessory protein n=1 Tax=Cyanothece sp. (strain PCC 7425 / ATCC 29141) TaxID=395961 RepID=B8HTR6_CYAP4
MIYLSASAATEVKRLGAKRRSVSSGFLRVGVQPGTCASLSYQMELVQHSQPQDHLFECQGIRVIVDPVSFPYLKGLTLDYSEDLMGGSFRFHNPNATQTCGCGNSFAVDS